MDKQTFFDQLHEQLAKRYHLKPTDIQHIRDLFFTHKKSLNEIGVFFQEKLLQTTLHKDRYLRQLAFLAKCSTAQWNDITQTTPYDKGADKPAGVT